MKSHKTRGFTLIEILIVILIIGILAAIAIPQYRFAVNKSRAMQAITTLKSITNAQEIYYLSHGKYTNKIEELEFLFPSSSIGKVWNTAQSSDPNQYLFICSEERSCSAWATNRNLPAFEFHMKNSPHPAFKHFEGIRWCKLSQGDRTNLAKELCERMGTLDTQNVAYGISANTYYILN